MTFASIGGAMIAKPYYLLRNFVLSWAATVFIHELENLYNQEAEHWHGAAPSHFMSARDFVRGDLQKFRMRVGGRCFLERLANLQQEIKHGCDQVHKPMLVLYCQGCNPELRARWIMPREQAVSGTGKSFEIDKTCCCCNTKFKYTPMQPAHNTTPLLGVAVVPRQI